MVSLRFLIGAILVYVGFFLFFVGFMNNSMSAPAFDELGQALLPIDVSTLLRGSLIQLAGGFLAVTGVLICLSSKQAVPSVLVQRTSDAQARIATPRTQTADDAPASVKCRFCGASMPKGAVFCSSCNRSQT